jgi:hypothetical protein
MGRVDLTAGFAVLAAGLLLALTALALAIVAFSLVWMEGRRGLSLAVKGFVLALAVLVWPGYLAVKAVVLPQLNDVSTDIDDPPASRVRAPPSGARWLIPGEVPARRASASASPIRRRAALYRSGAGGGLRHVRKAATAPADRRCLAPNGRIGASRIDHRDRTLIMRFPTINGPAAASRRRHTHRHALGVATASTIFGANAARVTRFVEKFRPRRRREAKRGGGCHLHVRLRAQRHLVRCGGVAVERGRPSHARCRAATRSSYGRTHRAGGAPYKATPALMGFGTISAMVVSPAARRPK